MIELDSSISGCWEVENRNCIGWMTGLPSLEVFDQCIEMLAGTSMEGVVHEIGARAPSESRNVQP